MKTIPTRLFLFALTNIAVIVTLALLGYLTGADYYVERRIGVDSSSLIAFCFLWGMGGAFISLLISRWVAKTALGIVVISPTAQSNLKWLAELVRNVARSAGLSHTPEVGVYHSEDVNAFATGPSQKRALVAFSSQLLKEMDKEAIEAVAAHEIGHIKNGDMVTMTLIQGVINAFIIIFARMIAFLASSAVKDRLQPLVWHLTFILADIVLGILGILVTSAFSRKREFRADAFSAGTVGSNKMLRALEFLKALQAQSENKEQREGLPASMAALGLSNQSSFLKFLSTHPPLEQRIAQLKKLQGL
jgi:heat shock protein HtpX